MGRGRSLAELMLDMRTPGELAPAADGRVAFTLWATVTDRPVPSIPADLYLLEGGAVTRLTNGDSCDHSPAWSPDGSRLAFLSDRRKPGHFLPYTLVPGEGPVRVAMIEGSTERIVWSAAGDRLLLIEADPGSYGLDASGRATIGAHDAPDPVIHRPRQAWRRLVMVDLDPDDINEVQPPGLSVWEVEWDGDRTAVGIVSDDPTGSGWYRARLARLDLEARTATTFFRSKRSIEGLALSPDGRHVAVVEGWSSDPHLLNGSVIVVDMHDGSHADPWPGLETVGHVSWIDDDTLVYGRADGTGTAFGRLHLDGAREELWAGDEFIGAEVTKASVTVLDDGSILTTHQAHGLPPEIARFDPEAVAWTRLTSFNRELFKGTVYPEVQTLSWRSPDGLEIGGLLLTPAGSSGPLPLLVAVHGGPTWLWNAYFSIWEPNTVALADAGYAVLMPNSRGSNGRGRAFAEAVLGDPGGKELDDIMAGVDLCSAKGVADPDRLGIVGLSWGGYMAAWAPTQTDVFRAAVAISVISNYVSYSLTADPGYFAQLILQGPWDPSADPDPYVDRSPITWTSRVSTPTLVIAGELDRCTPVGQGHELFEALSDAGVETELVVYPREGHLPFEREHVLDSYRRTQAWFDRFLRDR